MSAEATVGPPSTNTECTPCPRSAPSEVARSCPGRVTSPRGCRRTAASAGTGRSPSTTASGWSASSSPASPRAVRLGSSARTVPVPTRIASWAARCSWTCCRAAAPVIHLLVPSAAAARPSRLEAHFTVTHGRPSRTESSHRSRNASAWSARTPETTCDPGGAESVGATVHVGSGVVDRVDDPGDPGVEQCHGARSGAPDVVAGFEGDDRRRAAQQCRIDLGHRVDLGVRGAGALVPPLGEDLTGGREDHCADAGVVADGGPEGREFDARGASPGPRWVVPCRSRAEPTGGGWVTRHHGCERVQALGHGSSEVGNTVGASQCGPRRGRAAVPVRHPGCAEAGVREPGRAGDRRRGRVAHVALPVDVRRALLERPVDHEAGRRRA